MTEEITKLHKRHYEQFADGTVKDIEDEIPFEVPEGWAWCRLKQVCELKGGKRIPAGLSATKEKTNHIYIRVTDMQNNSISDADLVYITDDIFEKIQRYTINKDDLYLTIAGTIGRVGEVPEIFDGMNLTENALKLTNISICKKYLMQILNTKLVQDYFESTYHQVAMPKLSLINASKTIIPVPPLDEQQKIVNEIDNVFSITNNLDIDIVDLEDLITRTKSKILDLAIHGKLVPQDPNDEPAEELLKRIATSDNRPYKKFDDEEPFDIPESWSWCTLGEIYTHTTGKALKKTNNKGTLRKYITTSNLYWNSFDFTEVREMYFTDDELEKCTIKKGDLILCNGGDVGRAAIWNYDYDICYQNHVSRLRPKRNEINNKYFLYLLMIYKEQGMLNGKGVGITSLSAKDLLTIKVPLPPAKEQQFIANKIDEMFYFLDRIF